MIDPKPVAAFLEYTLKPLIEDATDLIQLAESNGINLVRSAKYAVFIFIFQEVMNLIKTVIITTLVCATLIYYCLHIV